MRTNAIEKNVIQNYTRLCQYMGSPLISKVPVECDSWKIDQYGSISYRDIIQLSVDKDKNKIKINKKPLFLFKSEILGIANRALDMLNDQYERLSQRDEGFKPSIRVFSQEQMAKLREAADSTRETHDEPTKQNEIKEESKFMKSICRAIENFISRFNKQ